MGTQTEKSGNSIVVAAMICVTALILGAMAMWCADGKRYQYILSSKDHNGNCYHIVFDSRTGIFYNRIGNIVDYVNAKTEKRKMEIEDASNEQHR